MREHGASKDAGHGMKREGGGSAPGGHGWRNEAGDAQRSGHVDVDDASELFRGRVDKVGWDLVGHSDVVDCWGGPSERGREARTCQ